jgi:hypothetical protein
MRPLRVPVAPAACGEWFWLPRYLGPCESCGRDELLSHAGRCAGCDAEARAAAKRGGRR